MPNCMMSTGVVETLFFSVQLELNCRIHCHIHNLQQQDIAQDHRQAETDTTAPKVYTRKEYMPYE